ncbi:MAG: hypothetical protein LUQ54_02150 [Methanoregula sp.]|nr:hypothetical protein [Methanoregula sp.]
MEEEQSGTRNSAGRDTLSERTPQSRQKKSHGLDEDKGMNLRQITRRS